jgi:hypothetical protein
MMLRISILHLMPNPNVGDRSISSGRLLNLVKREAFRLGMDDHAEAHIAAQGCPLQHINIAVGVEGRAIETREKR